MFKFDFRLPRPARRPRRGGRSMRCLAWLLAWSLCVSESFAQPTMSIDILDASDPGGPAPAGLLIVDIALDIDPSQRFANSGLVGRTRNGASIVYHVRVEDPNVPAVYFLPPGVEHRFTTFGSAGYERDDPARYAPAGTPAEPSIQTSAQYDGSGGMSIFTPDRIDVSWYPNPLPEPYFGRDGYMARIALDISAVSIEGGDDIENYRIFTPGTEPSGFLPVFVSDTNQATHGTSFPIFDPFVEVGRDWGVYVPEPSFSCIAVFVLFGLRHYSRRLR